MMFKALSRRIARKVLRGIVQLSYDDEGIQKLQMTFMAGDTWDKIERLQNYGMTSRPKKGAQGVGLFLDEDHGLVCVIDDRRYRIKNLKEGEVAIYDDLGQQITLTRTGIVIDAPQGLTLNGDILVNGTLTATTDVLGGGISLKSHNHPGDSGGTTGAPN